MNLNEFAVLPNGKAKSVKLNARNLQKMQKETVTLAQESKEMEERLQQLKEKMSKEKEERSHSGGFRWRSGQRGSFNSSALNSTNKSKENTLQKLSAGKVKVRVLKDEPLTGKWIPDPTKASALDTLDRAPKSKTVGLSIHCLALKTPPHGGQHSGAATLHSPLRPVPPKPLPPPPHPIVSQMPRKIRLRGTHCGQCQVKTAGLVRAECCEYDCIGCFTKFHHKGALKVHRMMPIQTDLQTHVSTRDFVSCCQKQMNSLSPPSIFTSPYHSPTSAPSPHHIKPIEITRQRDQRTNKGTETVAKPVQLHPDLSQVLAVNQEEKKVEMIVEGLKRADEKGFPNTLLIGEYDEEESVRVFQEALRQWRGEKSDGLGEPLNEDATWKSGQPVSVLATATQVDLAPDRGLEGPGRGERKTGVPVSVEFTENSLTYMDRLFLKKHRRTPFETYHPWLDFSTDLNLLPNANTGVKTASSQTAQEEAFHSYCVSLFSVPVRTDRAQSQTTAPKSYLTIEFLDESSEDTDGDFVAEQKTDNNSKRRKDSTVQRVLSKGGTQAPQTALTRDTRRSSRTSCSSPDATHKSIHADEPVPNLHLSEPQVFQAQRSESSSFSKSIQTACPTSDSPRISKTSIKTSPSTSQKPNSTPTVHKSKLDDGSSRWLHFSSLPHTPLVSARSPIPKDFLSHPPPSMSSSLRSTFTFSPLGSNELILLPQVYQSTSFQKGSNSSLLSEQPRFFQLLPETILSLEPSQSPASNLESTRRSQRSLCQPDTLLLMNQPQLLLSPVSSSQNPPSESLGPSPLVKALSSLSLCNESLPDVYCRNSSDPTNEDAPSRPLNIIQNTLAVNSEEEGQDSGDEMSIDSLDVIPYEEGLSDEEEAKLYRGLTRVRSGEEWQRDQPTHVERENDLQTEEEEQLSKTPDVSDAYWPSSSLSNYTEEHMVFRMMDNHKQHSAFQLHSATTTRREISVNQLGTNAGCHLSAKSMPVVSHMPAARYLSAPMLRSELSPALHVSSQTAPETNVQVGWEDPHLDTDSTSQTLNELGQEFRLMTQDAGNQASVSGATGSTSSYDTEQNHRGM